MKHKKTGEADNLDGTTAGKAFRGERIYEGKSCRKPKEGESTCNETYLNQSKTGRRKTSLERADEA